MVGASVFLHGVFWYIFIFGKAPPNPPQLALNLEP